MGIAEWFDTFNSNIRMSNSIVENISYRYKRITSQLNKDYYYTDSDIYHSLYVGSYGRDTEIFTSELNCVQLSDFLNRLFEFHCKENCSKRDCKYVCTRFRRIDGNRFVCAKHVRHKIDERQQQHKLTHHGHHN